ncbi:ArsR/SmtB family transcription factor [Streptomyces umbrinus]|uniref:ArsR/SmtB family transcription factor n=1 Tax=Streptomyces umbrinus TaxID=67370 RepID=UPI0033F728D7
MASAVRDWHQAVIAPLGQHVDARIEAARLSAARPLMTSGVDAMLSQLHPTISWAPPVLELATSDHDWDIHLDGRGLRLIPSYFYSREPAIHLDPDLPPIVIYPITHDTVWSPRPAPVLRPRHDTLAALLGHRRATLLQVITVGHGISTSALAHRTGVSPATVSHHTTALRDAGLITTHRAGGSAHHLPTPLGVQLVNGG